MEVAEAWSTTPWRLVGGTKTLWYARYMARREARMKYTEQINKELAARARKTGRGR